MNTNSKEKAEPNWTFERIICAYDEEVKPKLNELMKKGIGFDIGANIPTVKNKELLTADDLKFLNENRRAVLFCLHWETLDRLGAFDSPEKRMQLEIDYTTRLTALLRLSKLHGTIEDRAIKALHETMRIWFISAPKATKK